MPCATLTLEKLTDPAGYEDEFTLTATGSPTVITGATGAPAVTGALVMPGEYVLSEDGPSGWTMAGWECDAPAAAHDDVADEWSVTLANGDDTTCSVTNTDEPEVTITKVVWGTPTFTADGFSIQYHITVSNDTPAAAGVYDLSDSLTDLAAGVVVATASVSGPPEATGQPGWAGAAWDGGSGLISPSSTVIATDIPIEAGATHVYTVTVTGTLDSGDFVDGSTECSPQSPVPGEGLFNRATLTTDGVETDADACAPLPDVSVVKSVVPDSVSFTADGFSIQYQLVVTNTGPAASGYDVTDTLGFPTGLTVTSAAVTGSPAGVTSNAGWDGDTDTVIVEDASIDGAGDSPVVHTYTVTVTGTVDDSFDPETAACDSDAGAGNGLFNSTELTWSGDDDSDDTCTPMPHVTMEKSLVSSSVNGNDVTVVYEIVVTNDGEASSLYDVTDTLGFAPGLTVTSAAVTDSPASVTPNAGWDGDTDTVIVEAAEIGAAGDGPATHTYTVTVTGTVTGAFDPGAADCDSDAGAGHGLFNSAELSWAGTGNDDDACAPLPTLAISKTVTNADGDDIDGTQVVPGQTLIWTITIQNTSDTPYSGPILEDDLSSALAGVVLDGAPDFVVDPTGTVTTDFSGAPILTATAADLQGGDTVTITYSGTVRSQAELNANEVESIDNVVVPGSEITDCSAPEVMAPQALRAFASVRAVDVDDVCSTTNPMTPVVAISKVVTSGGENVDGATVAPGRELTWTITVENRSSVSYTGPLFTDDLTLVLAGVGTLTAAPASDSAAVMVTWASPSLSAAATDLPAGATATVTYTGIVRPQSELNAGNVTSIDNLLLADGEIPECDGDCETVSPLEPVMTVDKELVSITGSAASFAVTYRIVVTNTGSTTTNYTLSDALHFGDGVVIGSSSITRPSGVAAAAPAWDGVSNLVVASNVPLAAGASHTYTVTVNASAPTGLTASAADCALNGGETGTGLLNVATAAYPGHQVSDDACGAVPPAPPVPAPPVGELPATL